MPRLCAGLASQDLDPPQHSDYLLVGTTNADGRLQRSMNGGSIWETLGTSTTAMAADPNNPGIVYKGSANSDM